MAALLGLLVPGDRRRSPFVQRMISALVFPLLVLLALMAMVVFLPYWLLLQVLGKTGMVRLKMPPSCRVVLREEGFCRLDVMVPEEDREVAVTMLTAIVLSVAEAAEAGGEEARRAFARAARSLEYARSEHLEFPFGDAARIAADLYVDQGSFNAEVSVEGSERCVSAAARCATPR
jgi:hypothetical protein